MWSGNVDEFSLFLGHIFHTKTNFGKIRNSKKE